MIRNKLFALMALVFVAFSQTAHAQDPSFTQFYGNPLYLNPAMAGSANCPRVAMNHRNQWPSLKGAYITNSISFDKGVEVLHGGVGLQVINDIQGEGALTNTQINVLYSYHLQASRKLTVLTGIQAGYHQRSLDKSKLFFGDQIDPNYGFVFETGENLSQFADNVSYADIALGFFGIYNQRHFLGGAIHHVSEPEDSYVTENNLPRRITVHAGSNFPIGKAKNLGLIMDGPFLTPNILYMSQNGADQLNIGMSLTNESLSGGLYFRNNFSNSDAILIVAGYESNGIRLGYSYDYTISELMGASGGAHEVSLTIQLDCRAKRKKLKAIKCPKF
mgnify:FL=1